MKLDPKISVSTKRRMGSLSRLFFATGLSLLAGCQGASGPQGDQGTDGVHCWDLNTNGVCDPVSEDHNNDGACTVADCQGESSVTEGTITGTVTNVLTQKPIAGVQISLDPAIPGVSLTTDDTGVYKTTLPFGAYSLLFEKSNFAAVNVSANLASSTTTTKNIAMTPNSQVIVNAGADLIAEVGGTTQLKATIEIMDGSTLSKTTWEQTAGATASIDDPGKDITQITLPNTESYKQELIQKLQYPNRLMVVGINPDALAKARTASFTVTATTSSGTYQHTVDVTVDLPYSPSTGLQNVPKNVPVMVQGKSIDAYASFNWTLVSPDNSQAALDHPTSPAPVFTPDLGGKYVLTDTITNQSIHIYAEDWWGGIKTQDENGRPVMGCGTTMSCHNNNSKVKKDEYFTVWAQSGHAEIFIDNLNHAPYQKESCLACHAVGYDKSAANNGIDDAGDFDDFTASGMMSNPDPNNWTNMLANYKGTAALTNVQCESCHGPMKLTGVHGNDTVGDPECVSIRSDVCAMCHGQNGRYGRHQQWQKSGHGSYAGAISYGASPYGASDCGRCHAGQGFLAWIAQGDLTQTILADTETIGLTPDEVHPITCTACHDPHAVGNTTGITNDATVRISGDTPMLPAGVTAIGAGRGAVCFVCHNSAKGLHNDSAGDLADWSAPHAAQGDLMLGENAYFVSPGTLRSPHLYSIKDSCTACHMRLTPPPQEPGDIGDSTNHAFVADMAICAKCHGDYDWQELRSGHQAQLASLADKIKDDAIASLNSLTVRVRAYDPESGLFSSASYPPPAASNIVIDLATNPIVDIQPYVIWNDLAFLITLQDAVSIDWVSKTGEITTTTNHFGVQLESLKNEDDLVIFDLSSNMSKALWNYLLIESDRSDGIHNTRFSYQVIFETILQDLSR